MSIIELEAMICSLAVLKVAWPDAERLDRHGRRGRVRHRFIPALNVYLTHYKTVREFVKKSGLENVRLR